MLNESISPDNGATDLEAQTRTAVLGSPQRKRRRYREKGAGSITKIKKWFYLRSMCKGKTSITPLLNPDGTHCKNRIEAEKAAEGFQKILHATTKEEFANIIAENKKLKRQSGLSIHSAWDTFLRQPTRTECADSTAKKYEGQFMRFIQWITKEHPEIKFISDVDHNMALDFMQWLWGTGISAITYNKYAMALRLVFKHLMDPAALDTNPFDRIQHKRNEVVSRKEFSAEQVRAIFDGFQTGFFYETEVERLTTERKRERLIVKKEYIPMFKDEMRVLLCLCCYTGCRGQDGCLMKWNNIDLDKKVISFIPRKTSTRTGGRAVTLPIAPDLFVALNEALLWRGENRTKDDFVLPNVAARYRYNPSGIAKDVMKIIRCSTGLETTLDKEETFGRRKNSANAYGLHSFRHTFVSFCANAGVPYSVVASIVGHGNPSMTEHYSHIAMESKQKAIENLPSLSLPAPTGNGEAEDDAIEEPLSCRRRLIIDALPLADSKTIEKIEVILREDGLI